MSAKQPLSWFMLAAAFIALPIGATAQVTTEQGASIIVFPKVIADGTWDTVIQLANQTVNERLAHCFYVNGVPGPRTARLWEEIDFDVWLTQRQPTHWVVSRGRLDDPTDGRCSADNRDCDAAGFDPGRIPRPPVGFRGELLCVEADASGFPIPGNALIGKATLHHLASGGVTTYSAIGLQGFITNNLDNVLCLGGGRSAQCPNGPEYAGCPDRWVLNHPAEEVDAESGSSVTTSITVVPCTQNFMTQAPPVVTMQFVIYNEFEQRFSASTSVTCWADLTLATIDSPSAVDRSAFSRSSLGTTYAQTAIRQVPDNENPAFGFMLVAQTSRASGGADPLVTSTTLNVHGVGAKQDTDLITLVPMQQGGQ